jgi:excisionase family DNA binding protein
VSEALGSELAAVLEQLAERIAERVANRLLERERMASKERSPWMGIEQAASYLDWPRQRLYKLTASGGIPHYKHEGRLLFRRAELDSWLSGFAEGERSEIPSVASKAELLSPSMTTSEESGAADAG